MSLEPLLAPSVLNADFSNIQSQLKIVEENGADWIHLDIMDGHFVPNMTFGPLIVEAIRKSTNLYLDAHLMIENPEKYIEVYAKAGVQNINVHVEATSHLDAVVKQIKGLGCHAGVTLNPATPLSVLDYILPQLDMVLIMSVNPGFGGQKFIPYTFEKISALRKKIEETGKEIRIQVDGGISEQNIQEIITAGADVAVVGSAIYSAPNIASACQLIKTKMLPPKCT